VLQPLKIANAYSWSQWQAGHSLVANSYFFSSEGGNAVIDPLPYDEPISAHIDKLGGIATILVTTRDHEREAQALARRYSANIIREPEHEEEVFLGAFAIRLDDQKSEHEFAVSIPKHGTVIVGDSILGTPAGGLSLPFERRYADVRRAALGLRRILQVNPHTLLVRHGHSIFGGAYDAVHQLLYAHAGAEVHRINVDELDFHDERGEHEGQPTQYRCLDAEVGFVIGARKLGYRVSTLKPGHRFCPLHNHAREEELFFILDGEPSVRTLSGTVRCRKGDFVAFPVGEHGTHQLLNESDAPATVLLLARTEEVEACYYPDSDKLLVDTEFPMINGQSSMMVRGSPILEYFDGE